MDVETRVEVNFYSLLLIFIVSLVIHVAITRLMLFCSLVSPATADARELAIACTTDDKNFHFTFK